MKWFVTSSKLFSYTNLCIKDWCLMPFSVFNLFLAQWIIVILSEWWKPDNFELHLKNLALRIFEAFVRILWNVNHSSNQTLLIFLLYVKQTWMTEFILAISLWGVILLKSEMILLFPCMVLQFMWEKDFPLHGSYL